MKHTEHNAFLNEALEAINRIYKENKHLTQLRWFLKIALQRFNKDYLNSRKPQVIVLGDDIPAEVLYAVCDDPFYVLGGSLGTAHWADELTPRDTDPFSRSSLGWLINPEFDLTGNALIVTAVSSDSRRKLISVLRNNGRKVAALDIPPTRSANAVPYYKEQLTALAEMIGRHTGKHFTSGNLKRAAKRVANAHYQRQRFLSAAFSSGNSISDEAVLLANQCMYFADDLDEWCAHISALEEELRQLCRRYALPKKDRANVMILGSPVVFPNFKVPQLITSAGMNITAIADSLSLGASVALPKKKAFLTADSLLQQIAQTHLKMISSGARVSNEGLYAYFIKRKEMASKENRPRILVTGSPIVFPNFKLPLLIEEMGGALVADETCMGERSAYDPPAIADQSTDGIMRALANKSTRPCTCPTFTDNKRRVYRIMQMFEDYQVQGVIYHVLRGCLVYDYEYRVLEEEMGRLGVPIIRVESDYNEEDVEQLRIRVEAFIELIKYGRGGDSAIRLRK